MRKVVVTGLGFATSIGSSKEDVVTSLREQKHGFSAFPAKDGEMRTPHFYGSVRDYIVEGWDPEDWKYPVRFSVPRSFLKSMSPHVLLSYCSTLEALNDAGLALDEISNPETGLYSASSGSSGLQHKQLKIMNERGVGRCSPYSVVSTTVGTINFNLGAALKIQGAVCGFASACASSAHALGMAYDMIALGRQDRMIVIGAEDPTRETILPFATMRALSNADTRNGLLVHSMSDDQVLWDPVARQLSFSKRPRLRRDEGPMFTRNMLVGARLVMAIARRCRTPRAWIDCFDGACLGCGGSRTF